MRALLHAVLFLAALAGVLSTNSFAQQPSKGKADPKAKAALTKPDDATLKQIAEKTAQLRTAVEGLKARKVPDDVVVEVEVHLKSSEYIVKFNEWFTSQSGKQTLTTLDRGLERAKQANGGEAPWRNAAGKWVLRAYRSKVDGSAQPYAVQLPADYGKDPNKKWRLDVVLHGRDGSLTETKFIATHDGGKVPADQPFVQLEVYGRGNNAYRWAGETDVFEAYEGFMASEEARLKRPVIDAERVVIRGFSMGGAGSWHLGFHHPFRFAAMGPGAGFSVTHGYIKDIPNPLPEPQEATLRIYDAVDYAENAVDIPVVAYSGGNDPQKASADNVEKALQKFPEKVRFTRLVAPGLEHKMPLEWMAKAEVEYRKHLDPPREFPKRVRYVTYTTKYPDFGWGTIERLGKHYEKAVVDGTWENGVLALKLENVDELTITRHDPAGRPLKTLTVNGQAVRQIPPLPFKVVNILREWMASGTGPAMSDVEMLPAGKRPGQQGPIDDAFTSPFAVTPPTGPGWHDGPATYAAGAANRFAAEWEKWMRGTLPSGPTTGNVVLFGDPGSNPQIARMLVTLPITWTKDKLVVNGVSYDSKTHIPTLIYPHPFDRTRYLVINSGHTFHEAEFKGTNAGLYPRLGDWAVLKVAPTAKDPTAAEVVAGGLFDENWQFPKK